jgi:DNA-binding PadR family transcriptional regulator
MAGAPTRVDVFSRLPLQPRDYLILFALADGPRHGHALLKAIETQSGGVMIDPANLYRSLRRMDRGGMVDEVADPAPEALGPPRRCYALTRLGRAVLEAEASRLSQLADAAKARRLVRPGRAAR